MWNSSTTVNETHQLECSWASRTFRALKKLFLKKSPNWFFLRETKLLVSQLEISKFKLGIAGCIGVDRVGLGGGLCLFWKESVYVKLLSYSVGYKDTMVEVP